MSRVPSSSRMATRGLASKQLKFEAAALSPVWRLGFLKLGRWFLGPFGYRVGFYFWAFIVIFWAWSISISIKKRIDGKKKKKERQGLLVW